MSHLRDRCALPPHSLLHMLAVVIFAVVSLAAGAAWPGAFRDDLAAARGELINQLVSCGTSPAAAERFVAAASLWDAQRVATSLTAFERKGMSAEEQGSFLASLGRYQTLARGSAPAGGKSTFAGSHAQATNQEIIDALFSTDPTTDCRPYLVGVTVSPSDPLLVQTKPTYGAAGFPTDGPDFLVMSSGNPDFPSEVFDVDLPPAGTCDGDWVEIDFSFSFPDDGNGEPVIKAMRFDMDFLSYEYPDFVGQINDYAYVYLDTATPIPLTPTCDAPVFPASGCMLTKDRNGQPTNVNSAYFDYCSVIGCDLPSGIPGWDTVYNFTPGDDAGRTGLLSVCTPTSCAKPLVPGAHTLSFIIGDAVDGVYSSVALFDNLRCYHDAQCTGGIGTPICPKPAMAPQVPICPGDSITLDASTTDANSCPSPLAYQFREGANILKPWGSASTFGPVFPLATTTYTVDVSCPDPNYCEQSIDLSVVVAPEISLAVPAQAVACPGVGMTLGGTPTASGGTPPFTYTWTPPTGLDDPTSPNPVATPSTTTTYTLTVKDGNGCQSVGGEEAVVLPAMTHAVPPSLPSCIGAQVTLGGAPTVSGGKTPYSYLWTPPTDLDDPTSANPVATLTAARTYHVVVTDGAGCQIAADEAVDVSGGLPGSLGNTLKGVHALDDITFSWLPVGNADNYLLRRAPTKDFSVPDAVWNPVPPSMMLQGELGLATPLYFYRVTARSCAGEGP